MSRMIVRIDSMNCGLGSKVERSPTCVAMIDGKMNVHFFVNTLSNRGHRQGRTRGVPSFAFLFVLITIHSGISTRKKDEDLAKCRRSDDEHSCSRSQLTSKGISSRDALCFNGLLFKGGRCDKYFQCPFWVWLSHFLSREFYFLSGAERKSSQICITHSAIVSLSTWWQRHISQVWFHRHNTTPEQWNIFIIAIVSLLVQSWSWCPVVQWLDCLFLSFTIPSWQMWISNESSFPCSLSRSFSVDQTSIQRFFSKCWFSSCSTIEGGGEGVAVSDLFWSSSCLSSGQSPSADKIDRWSESLFVFARRTSLARTVQKKTIDRQEFSPCRCCDTILSSSFHTSRSDPCPSTNRAKTSHKDRVLW